MNDRQALVALYLPSLTGGGAERVMVSVANELVSRGTSVHLVLASANGPLLAEVNPQVRVIDLRCRRVATSLPGFIRYLRKYRPEAVLSTMTHANIVALLAKHLARVPARFVVREAIHISTAIRDETTAARYLMPAFMRLLYPTADAIVAPSVGVAQDLESFLGVESSRLHVISNPVDVDRLQTLAAERIEHPWFRPDSPPVLLAVGRLHRQKDYRTMIEAFALVRRRRDVKLIILGEGSERQQIEQLAMQSGVTMDIRLLGFVPNPFPYMRACAVFVQTSRFEGMPNALVQAVALGCKAVATDCPSGPREVLRANENSRLVPVGNAAAVACAIEELLDQSSTTPPNAIPSTSALGHVIQQYRTLLHA